MKVVLPFGRVAQTSARTMNTVTGQHVWLTQTEARKLRLPGSYQKKYSFSICPNGQVERWVNGFGGVVKTLPRLIVVEA